MDAQRFDDLARALARRASRRAVLRGAAGGATVAALARAGNRPAAAQGECPAGQTPCDGVCVDLATDMDNCGACGEVCESSLVGVACIEGECVRVTCPALLTDCGTGGEPLPVEEHCFDLQTDPFNCGECGNACATGACANGTCTQDVDEGPDDGSGELGDLGDACSEVLPCRPEYVCAGGVCSEPDEDDGPTTLPDTGSGPGATRPGAGWAPAALAASAALAAAGLRRVLPRRATGDR